ncbi:MAG: hypothetical protein L6R39_007586, partial [Caloplaca ligustica]
LVGYWARAYSTKNLEDFTSFSISQLLIMLGPSVLAAGLYQAFGRLLYYTVPPSHRTFRTLFMPARFIAPVFVVLDVVAFFIQLIGLGIALQSINKDEEDMDQEDKDAQKRGVDILRVGLIVQLLVFGIFAVLCVRIVLISKRWQFAWPDAGKWRALGWIVATGSFLITVGYGTTTSSFAGTVMLIANDTVSRPLPYLRIHHQQWRQLLRDT